MHQKGTSSTNGYPKEKKQVKSYCVIDVVVSNT